MPTGFSKPTATPKLSSTSRHKSDPNPNVSQLSKFLDDVWDFAADMKIPSSPSLEKRISWGFEVREAELFTDPKYAGLQLPTKQLFYSLLQHTEEGPPQKPGSILTHWSFIKKLIMYLVTLPRPILRYDLITPKSLARYVKHLRQTDRSNATVLPP